MKNFYRWMSVVMLSGMTFSWEKASAMFPGEGGKEILEEQQKKVAEEQQREAQRTRLSDGEENTSAREQRGITADAKEANQQASAGNLTVADLDAIAQHATMKEAIDAMVLPILEVSNARQQVASLKSEMMERRGPLEKWNQSIEQLQNLLRAEESSSTPSRERIEQYQTNIELFQKGKTDFLKEYENFVVEHNNEIQSAQVRLQQAHANMIAKRDEYLKRFEGAALSDCLKEFFLASSYAQWKGTSKEASLDSLSSDERAVLESVLRQLAPSQHNFAVANQRVLLLRQASELDSNALQAALQTWNHTFQQALILKNQALVRLKADPNPTWRIRVV